MSLKTKIITLIFTFSALYGVVEYAVQHFVLLPAFVRLERNAAENNTDRALQALDHDVELLIPSTSDWGTWDDTYWYMVDRNIEYSDSNLNGTSLKSLNVNFLGLYDLKGIRLWGMAYNNETGSKMTLGELSDSQLNSTNPLLGDAHSNDTVAGIYTTAAGIFMIASSPILPSSGEGPSRGRIIMGRLLDKAAIDRLGTRARVRLHAEPLIPAAGIQVKRSDDNSTIGHTPIVVTESDIFTRGSTDVLDITGRPVLRFQVTTPNDILIQGRTTLKYASISLAVAGVVVLLVILVFLRRTVFDPVSSLTRHAIAVGTRDDLSVRLQMKRNDEIGTLANEFDIMVARLAETRQRLLDQSYKSGVAEMASGALHNIGNAITPIGVKLVNLRRDLKQAPVREIAIAGAELANPATSADRKAELAKFTELAGGELTTLVTRATEILDSIQSQVDLVQMVLTDQQRFSRAERTIENLELDRLVNETIGLLPDGLHRIAHIEIDQSVAKLGHVRAARVALQQIISNLVINSADSISESGQQEETGRIRIYTDDKEINQQAMAHICIDDNGMGISLEQMERLFERGYSTKPQGSGIGLHWCANTVSAMGGRIYATSPGIGKGACLHILLPLAELKEEYEEYSA